MSEGSEPSADGGWTPWVAIRGYSGFEVHDERGRVAMAQTGLKDFAVTTSFRFADPVTLEHYRDRLRAAGADAAEADRMLDEARTLRQPELATDLASVPRFMAWFESSYGRHTLAAILHDELIDDDPNTGALRSDTLADSFFRDMMGVAGVPFFKRWLMWAAVAARTRWVAGGRRRASLVLWGLLALSGITMAIFALVAAWSDVDLPGGWDGPGPWVAGAVVLPFIAALLWGKQYGAGIVAAAAGLWLVPAAVIVAIGLAVYWLSERVASIIRPVRSGDRTAQRPD